MIGRINREAVNSSSKYLAINRAESVGQIVAPALEPVHVERSTSNALPPQKEYIQTQSTGHDSPKRVNMTSSSLVGMHIQFRTLTFYSSMEEQLQECLLLKKSTTSLSAAIGALALH
jgi:hypothetical protein